MLRKSSRLYGSLSHNHFSMDFQMESLPAPGASVKKFNKAGLGHSWHNR